LYKGGFASLRLSVEEEEAQVLKGLCPFKLPPINGFFPMVYNV
jgi:hypothetical protein